jgi:hypothetical protein
MVEEIQSRSGTNIVKCLEIDPIPVNAEKWYEAEEAWDM